MADIILAEHRGNTWMVCGVEYIDAFLANMLSPDVTITTVTCESESEFQTLWNENDGRLPGTRPWIIHPKIAQRAKAPRKGYHIVFGPWSANLDDAARGVLRDIVTEADQKPDAPVVMLSHVNAASIKPQADMTNIRCSLIEAELTRLGVDASRIVHATRGAASDNAEKAEADTIEVAFKFEDRRGQDKLDPPAG